MRTSTDRAYTPAGVIAAVAGVITWGMGVVFTKLTTSSFLLVTFYRHAFSVPLLIVAWRLSRERSLPWRAAGAGGVLFAAHQLANFSALRYSTAAVVTILFSLQPIVVGAFGRRYVGEAATARFYAWSTVAVAGCAAVVIASTGGAGTTPLGAALAVTNLVAWCAYYLASKRARDDVSALSWLLVMTVVSGVIITVVAVVAGAPLGSPDAGDWPFLVAIGVIPGTIGHLLVTWAHPRIHVAASSALILGVPIVATAGTALFAGESFGWWEVCGAALALVATGMAMRHLPPPVNAEAAGTYGELAS